MRIHIVGGSGSGKTYIAQKLAARLNLPHYDLDELFWDNTAPEHNTRAEPAARDARLTTLVAQDDWILEGVYYKWLLPSFAAADHVIVLTVPLWLRQVRIIRRFAGQVFTAPNSLRPGALSGLITLLRWNAAYDRDDLPAALLTITKAGKEPLCCQSLRDVLKVFDKPHAATQAPHAPENPQ